MTEEQIPLSNGDIELLTAQTKGVRLKLERGEIPIRKCSCIYGKTAKGATIHHRDSNCPLHGRGQK